MEDFRKVGKVKDAHALKGELYIYIFSGEWDWIEELEEAYLLHPDGKQKQTLEIERVKSHKDGFILKSKNITDRTAAEKLKGWEFFIPAEHFVSDEDDDTLYLSEIANFTVYQQEQKIGIIVGFLWNGAQDLLVVENEQGTQYEIPYVDEFVEELDLEGKYIKMQLPEGLLEINLENADQKSLKGKRDDSI